MILGKAVIVNGSTKSEFIVENNVPILRQNDILTPDKAQTPALRIYLAVQLMYVDPENLSAHQKIYWQLIDEFLQAAPSALALIDRINELILKENYYQALKLTQKLISFEQEVVERVTKCC